MRNLACKGVEPVAVAARAEGGKAVAGGAAHRVVHEQDERHGLGRSEVDADVGRRHVVRDDENVGALQGELAGGDDEQRPGRPQPQREVVLPRAAAGGRRQTPVHEQRLHEAGAPRGDDGGGNGRLGFHRQAGRVRGHHGEEQQCRAHDVRRHHGQPHPRECLADPVLHPGERVDGHAHQRQIRGQHEMAVERLEQIEAGNARSGDERAEAERHAARAAHDTAQQSRLACLAVLRHEADGGDAETRGRRRRRGSSPTSKRKT